MSFHFGPGGSPVFFGGSVSSSVVQRMKSLASSAIISLIVLERNPSVQRRVATTAVSIAMDSESCHAILHH
jgi:hypothetical protein